MEDLENNKASNNDESEDDEMDFPDEDIDEMEKMNFDFEAFPPSEEDIEGLENLLAQIFLRAEINRKELADSIIKISPFGCVYKPAEESEDEDSQSLVCGVLSIVGLTGKEKHSADVSNFVLQRAKKFATGSIFKQFERCLQANDGGNEVLQLKTGFLINERLLQFPVQISAPAFSSLCQQQNSDGIQNPKKKVGKAERRKLLTDTSDVIFDNPEEELLFTIQQQFPYFQYPVESEVESTSRFNCIRRNGQVYRPYRRICLLTEEQFLQFAQLVSNSSF
uniref:Protein BCCIP homolog n=1 Tax=Meloidogyne hapla TaxID=6305 RepID=A0A1I8B4I1_MELHA